MLGMGELLISSGGASTIYRYLRLAWPNSAGWAANPGFNEVKFYANGTAYPQSMTGAMSPAPYVASASSYYSDGNDGVTNAMYPWRAFDGSTGTDFAASGNAAGYIQIDLGPKMGICPDTVDLRCRANGEGFASPLTLYGSNDGTTFELISSFTFSSWTAGVTKTFSTGVSGRKDNVPGTRSVYTNDSTTTSSFTVPTKGQIACYVWGAAGGSCSYGDVPGGPGGYAHAIFEVNPGQNIMLGAGQGGVGGYSGNGPKIGGTGANGIANGGNSGTGTDNYNHGGSGGGASIVWIDSNIRVVGGAGGGNGAETGRRGGSGGGVSGGDGNFATNGGTQTGPGGNATGMNGGTGTDGRESGGGGGGGWYGGGGGGSTYLGGGGYGSGGGSGYVHSSCLHSELITAAYASTSAPKTTNNAYWGNSAGNPVGAPNTRANGGRAVVVYYPYA